jgi:paraquat-inducible protein B
MTVEDLIKEQIEQLDIKELVQQEIRRLISDDVKREITKTTKEEIQRIIKTEVEICMSKGVQTDDGWGKKETYSSFEELFKKHFKSALDSTYEVKKTVERHVKDECEKLVKANTQQIVDALKRSLGA